jgi:hypothetical protein
MTHTALRGRWLVNAPSLKGALIMAAKAKLGSLFLKKTLMLGGMRVVTERALTFLKSSVQMGLFKP